jgi:serine/threonine protein kinase
MITLQKSRYEAFEPLGSGATSRVEKARDTVIGRTVALKTFLNGFGEGQEKQFLREAQLIGQLSNPSIVQLYDVGINEQGTPFLVMEYVSGKTLEQHLDPSTLPFQRACAWAADLAGALGVAHRAGILHGDVKPGNIFVTAENKVKLGDFGIARYASQVSGSGLLMGTPAYLAPEQIQGEPQDARSDQFALGIVLYQMLTGVRPFNGSSLGAVCAQILNADPEPPSRRNPAVPVALDRIVARCLAKNPADRFASCDELASALYPLARARTQPPPAPVIKNRSWWSRPTGQQDVWIAAVACLLLAFSVAAVRSGRTRLAVLPPPAGLRFTATVPPDAFLYTSQTVEAVPPPDSGDASSPAAYKKNSPQRQNHSAQHASVRKTQPKDSRNSPSQTFFAALPTLPLVKEPPAQAAPRSALQIEITSAVNEGTLTVFADRELLFSADLASARRGQPIHFEHALAAGPHQFRVALYKADRSLQLEKEGFAETRGDGADTLAVHVTRRAKLLVRRELTLEVIWPGALAPAAEHASGTTVPVRSAALVN